MVETLDEGDRLICDNDEQVDFWLSGDKKMATKLGVLTFVAEYQERFLVGNTICEGKKTRKKNMDILQHVARLKSRIHWGAVILFGIRVSAIWTDLSHDCDNTPRKSTS